MCAYVSPVIFIVTSTALRWFANSALGGAVIAKKPKSVRIW
nr:MAG TPA: hypothetical protein [Caudoviricetes sp.]